MTDAKDKKKKSTNWPLITGIILLVLTITLFAYWQTHPTINKKLKTDHDILFPKVQGPKNIKSFK